MSNITLWLNLLSIYESYLWITKYCSFEFIRWLVLGSLLSTNQPLAAPSSDRSVCPSHFFSLMPCFNEEWLLGGSGYPPPPPFLPHQVAPGPGLKIVVGSTTFHEGGANLHIYKITHGLFRAFRNFFHGSVKLCSKMCKDTEICGIKISVGNSQLCGQF